jgi:hypothetical protein
MHNARAALSKLCTADSRATRSAARGVSAASAGNDQSRA